VRQVWITGPRAIALTEVQRPACPPGWARIRVAACALCGTDAHLASGAVHPPDAPWPLVPGHEVAGVVEEAPVGSPVAAGELVVAHLLAPCGDCPACREGEEQRCRHAPVLGIQEPGGLAGELCWPAARLVGADGLDPATAAMLPDAGATAHHALRLASPPRGGLLCVLGAGGVGGHVLAIARALDPTLRLAAVVRTRAGAERVATSDVTVLTGLDGAARTLTAELGPAEAVVDFTGSTEAPAQAVRMLRPGGMLVLGSVTPGDLALGWITPFVNSEITVAGCYSSTLNDLRSVVALAHSGALPPRGAVSHRLPLSRATEAFELLAKRPPGLARIVVEPEEGP
jgi:2-desacetyl-2-hydroxyethyl bacteriochlorophyllide A dehydrogenase